MSRQRIEALLASFPKLIPAGTQHTSIETPDVRYVYQPLEDLYILLLTNKSSNILQDIDTLHLFARIVSDLCRSLDEREISNRAFELLGAFDEVVSLGYRENVTLTQVRSVLEMESHEEKIQEIIARNKEAEAKEELKRRAKQLEMQRREQQKQRAAGLPVSSFSGGYSSVPRFEGMEHHAPAASSYSGLGSSSSRGQSPAPRAPAFKSSGMKLGSKKTKQAELLDALGGEVLEREDISTPGTPAVHDSDRSPLSALPKVAANDGRGSIPAVDQLPVHIVLREHLSLSLAREGGVESLEVKGDMNLHISDPAFAHIKLVLKSLHDGDLQFKQHPNVAKFTPRGEKVIALKDPKRAFPVGQALAVLKWRYTGKDESFVPLSSAWFIISLSEFSPK